MIEYLHVFSDPTIWAGFLTLIVLELVLGIDNLVFIAILADKLPPKQRDAARIIGLTLAMLMRLALLFAISWLVTLTRPLFYVGTLDFSGRDLILFLGGLFLLFKATTELHSRLEGRVHSAGASKAYASFGIVVTQIVVLDAVFSLDAVITAVGMVDELPVMMSAVVIAMIIMLIASKPLTRFVNAHPTVVVLCLSFLLMIGLSLIADGLGFHLPKGYLYAAIGFSILIEFFNQVARRNIRRLEGTQPLRERTAETVLRLLGGKRAMEDEENEAESTTPVEAPAFCPDERNMVSGVLSLAERSIRSVMTPRAEISWVDLEANAETIRMQLLGTPHGRFPVCRGSLDKLVGVGRAKDLINDIHREGRINERKLHKPIIVPESIPALNLIDHLRAARGQIALVSDEHGTIQGLVTPIDVLEAIAGEFPDEDETMTIQSQGEGTWLIDAGADLHHVEQELEITGLVSEDEAYTTLGGYLTDTLGRLPDPGEVVRHERMEFHVDKVDGTRIDTVIAVRRTEDEESLDLE